MTLSQLEHIKNEVIQFIGAILNGMKICYDNKLYLREPEQKKKKASECCAVSKMRQTVKSPV